MNEHQKSIKGTITSTHSPTERNYPQVQPSKSEIANIHKVSGLYHFPNFKSKLIVPFHFQGRHHSLLFKNVTIL